MLISEHRACSVLLDAAPYKGQLWEDMYGNLWTCEPSQSGWSLVHFYNKNCVLTGFVLAVINLPGLRKVEKPEDPA